MKKKENKLEISKGRIIVFLVVVVLTTILSTLIFGSNGVESSGGNIIVQLGE